MKKQKEHGSDLMKGVAEVTMGSSLLNALIAQQKCLEEGMAFEAGVFGEAAERARTELTAVGLDPDKVLQERIRLLTAATQKQG